MLARYTLGAGSLRICYLRSYEEIDFWNCRGDRSRFLTSGLCRSMGLGWRCTCTSGVCSPGSLARRRIWMGCRQERLERCIGPPDPGSKGSSLKSFGIRLGPPGFGIRPSWCWDCLGRLGKGGIGVLGIFQCFEKRFYCFFWPKSKIKFTGPTNFCQGVAWNFVP